MSGTTALHSMPGLPAGLARAVATLARRPREDVLVAPASLRLSGIRVERSRLDAYRALCGFAPGEVLPLTYPQVLAFPLLLHVFTRAEFPLPVPGLVHVASVIDAERELVASGELEAEVELGAGELTGRGQEFEIETRMHDGHGCAWRGRMRLLWRARERVSSGAEPLLPGTSGWSVPLPAPPDVGWRYAQVAGDFNPIHLSAWSARLFGFKRAIAPGMWALARAVALVEDRRARSLRHVDVGFRRPLYLPATAKLRFGSVDPTPFAILSSDETVIHLAGTLG